MVTVGVNEDVIAIFTSATSVAGRTIQATANIPANGTEDSYEISVIGLPGPIFTVIHAGALTSLTLTVLISSWLIAYLCNCRNSAEWLVDGSKRIRAISLKLTQGRGKAKLNSTQLFDGISDNEDQESSTTQRIAESSTGFRRPTSSDVSNGHSSEVAVVQRKNGQSFHQKNVGERLVVYLAVSDLLLGISHMLDHSYMLIMKDHPPDAICEPMAFLLLATTLSQWLVVLFTAVSACSLIVYGKKLSLGRCDWKLLIATFGLASAVAGLSWILDVLGPSGAWCCFDFRTERGQIASRILSFAQLTAFAIVTVAYGAIWMKIQRTARLVTSDDSRYSNSARVMLIFVAVFILQWWPLPVFYFWDMISRPPAAMFITLVLIVNLGGVYNCIAYTIIRHRIKQQKISRGTQVIYRFGNLKNVTVDNSAALSHRFDGR